MKSKLTLYSLLGVFSVCIGIAFLNNTLLGNDPIGVFYDGIREFSGFSQPELGKVSNYINIILLVFLFVCGRNYFSVGTFLYLIPYGSFISIGSRVYTWLFVNIDSSFRIIISILGCLLYYFGISLFIACNIGTDPFNGFVFAIQDKIGWSLRKVKISLDILLV
ncbi:YczE/YyaS/YitT family protein, partial [Enterococcus avium]